MCIKYEGFPVSTNRNQLVLYILKHLIQIFLTKQTANGLNVQKQKIFVQLACTPGRSAGSGDADTCVYLNTEQHCGSHSTPGPNENESWHTMCIKCQHSTHIRHFTAYTHTTDILIYIVYSVAKIKEITHNILILSHHKHHTTERGTEHGLGKPSLQKNVKKKGNKSKKFLIPHPLG